MSLQTGAAEINMEDVKKLILGEEKKHALQTRRMLSEEDFEEHDLNAVSEQVIESEDLEYQQNIDSFHSLSQAELEDNDEDQASDSYANAAEETTEAEDVQKEDLSAEPVEDKVTDRYELDRARGGLTSVTV
eukprot:451460-Hanusia_phi.AAC.8